MDNSPRPIRTGKLIFTHQYLELEPPEDGSNPDPEGAQNFFEVDTNGTIRTIQSLNFETDPVSFDLTIWAEDPSGLISEGNFTISVLDLQEAPGAITLSANTIEENQPAGTVVGQLFASDPDGEALIFTHQYVELEPPEDGSNPDPEGAQNFFEVDTNGTIRTTQSLNFEADPVSFDLTIWAEDPSGLISEGNFTISVLDQVEFHVMENQPADTLVGSVVNEGFGSKPDWLDVSIISEEHNEFFYIDQEGNIRTTKSLDFESDPQHFELDIHFWGEPPSDDPETILQPMDWIGSFDVSVLDEDPEFSFESRHFEVLENLPADSIVGSVLPFGVDPSAIEAVYDAFFGDDYGDGIDFAPADFHFGSFHEYFRIDEEGNIRTLVPLDFESDPTEFEFVVEFLYLPIDETGDIIFQPGRGSFFPFTFSISVLDEDPEFSFESRHFEVLENLPADSIVGSVLPFGVDPSAIEAVYDAFFGDDYGDGIDFAPADFHFGSFHDYFRIDEEGNIRTLVPLDFESDPTEFEFVVEFLYQPIDETGDIIFQPYFFPFTFSISVLDEDPEFSFESRHFEVLENLPADSIVGSVLPFGVDPSAIEAVYDAFFGDDYGDGIDFAPADFHFGSFHEYFRIDEEGNIRTLVPLDFESDPTEFEFVVEFLYLPIDETGEIIFEEAFIPFTFNISVLDEDPEFSFESRHFEVLENLPADSIVGSVLPFGVDSSAYGIATVYDAFFGNDYADGIDFAPADFHFGSFHDYFRVDEEGNIRTLVPLDFESDPTEFEFVVEFAFLPIDETGEIIFEEAFIPFTFNISVLDEDPEFSFESRHFEVLENLPADSIVGSVLPFGVDPSAIEAVYDAFFGDDYGDGIDFAPADFHFGSFHEYFRIDEEGNIRTLVPLDFESDPTEFEFVVEFLYQPIDETGDIIFQPGLLPIHLQHLRSRRGS